MTGETHGAIGLATGIGMVYVTGADSWLDVVLSVAIAFFASLLPDMDAEQSVLQSMILPGLSRKVRSAIYLGVALLFGMMYVMVPQTPLWVLLIAIFLGIVVFAPHRTITHSLFMVIYLGMTVHLISPEWMWVFVAGYLSHLIADALTVSGIPFLWPFPIKFSLSQIGIRIKTGTAVDQWIGMGFIGLFVLGIFYLFV